MVDCRLHHQCATHDQYLIAVYHKAEILLNGKDQQMLIVGCEPGVNSAICNCLVRDYVNTARCPGMAVLAVTRGQHTFRSFSPRHHHTSCNDAPLSLQWCDPCVRLSVFPMLLAQNKTVHLTCITTER